MSLDEGARFSYQSPGPGVQAVDSFDLSTNTWRTDWPKAPFGVASGGTVYDPTLKGFWFKTSTSWPLSFFDPAGNSKAGAWSLVGGTNYNARYTNIEATMALDTKRHQLVSIGYYGIYKYDLNTSTSVSTVPVTSGDAGGIALEKAIAPGFVYDPVGDRFIGWNGGTSVYALDPVTFVWTKLATYSGNTAVDPGSAAYNISNGVPTGTYGRFRYVPSAKGVIVVNSTTNSVFFYKLTNTPSPNPTPSVTLTANPATVNYGDSITLSWSSTNATSCTASGGWSGTLATSGSQVLNNLTNSKTYTLTCTGLGGSSSSSVTETVILQNHFWIGLTGYTTLQAAINAASPGDTINVDAGIYVDMYADINKSVTIQGTGGFAHFLNDQNIPNGKGILLTEDGNTIALNNLELSGAMVSDANGANGAGIRYQGSLLTVENSYFHDNQNGILGGVYPTGQIAIVNSVFDHNGQCPPTNACSHGVYLGNMAKVTISNSTFRNTNTGHHIKSRAVETDISNTLEDDGTVPAGASYDIDIPNGGIVNITCNEIIKNPNAQNSAMITFGEENNLHSINSLNVTDSLFTNNIPLAQDPHVVGINNTVSAMTAIVSSNTFVRVPAGYDVKGPAILSNNTDTATDTAPPNSCGPIGASLSTPPYVAP
jgi:hypothetical protein